MFDISFTCENTPPPPEPQSITVNRAYDQQTGGDMLLDADIAGDDESVEMLLYLASTAKPTADLFGASSGADPSDGLGGGYLDGGTIQMATTGDLGYFDLPDGMVSASYKYALLPTGGGDSDVVEIGPVTLDTSPPVFVGVSPANGTVDVPVQSTITLTFNKYVLFLGGTITLRNLTDGVDVAVFNVTEFRGEASTFKAGGLVVAFNWDNTITITNDKDTDQFPSGKDLTVYWSAGALMDLYRNPIEANSATLFSITTA